MSTDALNCGTVDVKLNELVMQSRSGEEILSINLSRVKNCAVPVHNEVEVQCDTDGLLADQEACDMIRFFVPPDVDGMANAEELCDDVKALTNTSQGRYSHPPRPGCFLWLKIVVAFLDLERILECK